MEISSAIAGESSSPLETPDYFDAFGFHHDLHERWMRICHFYFKWLRVKVDGLEHVPAEGPALFVGNHAGARMHDINSLLYAVRRLHPAQRIVRPLASWKIGRSMVGGHLTFNYAGAVIEHPRNADYLLQRGELALVYPEGSWSTVKVFRDRNRLCAPAYWGNSFVRTALRNQVRVIPVVAHGFEAAIPTLWRSRLLARFWGLRIGLQPVYPQTFLAFGHPQASCFFPIPVRCRLSIGRPIDLNDLAPPAGIHSPEDIRKISLEVRAVLEQRLEQMSALRRG